MKIVAFLRDKIITIFIYILIILSIVFILFVLNISYLITLYITSMLVISFTSVLLLEYYKKKNYYNNLINTINKLDKLYLITEIIKEPNFLEGKILYDSLYEINKSMHENVNKYKNISEEFKEYIELWCHEIKLPLTTSKIIIENNKNEITKNINEEIDKIEYFIEQMLFYARSETIEKDYIIKSTNLKKVVEDVIKKNKKILIFNKIKIECNNLDISVNSDSKWLEFIINQVLINSIKYSKNNNAKINVMTEKNKNNIKLMIEDNGVGIKEEELGRVFDKGFTGSNGRSKYNSTGIGLYLVKKMCNRLDHDIVIESKENEGTIITFIFPISSLTKM